jgi:predicted aldo/keto reductase-like oxidoreductase
VRTDTELQKRSGAFNTMVKLKKEGKVRAIGLSSHGLSVLKSILEISEIDLVWARINYAGLNMDTDSLGIYD